jgi:hypothetical protein
MVESVSDYYRRRADEERACADRAVDLDLRRIHLQRAASMQQMPTRPQRGNSPPAGGQPGNGLPLPTSRGKSRSKGWVGREACLAVRSPGSFARRAENFPAQAPLRRFILSHMIGIRAAGEQPGGGDMNVHANISEAAGERSGDGALRKRLSKIDKGVGPSGEPRRRYRTIWISDVHLGTRGCNDRLLIDFLDHVDPRRSTWSATSSTAGG